MMCPACNARYEGGQFCAKDGTPLVQDASAPRTDFVGQVLADRYRIVRLLGEGGMGQVFEAQHVNINKRFAIKLLRPEIVSNHEAVQRFRQEAWSASSIGHDNIIEIDDFATLPNGAVYLAMEFLAGQSLSERMKAGPPLEVADALDVFVQVCRGLSAAHEKGIIHRDMKPENVFLSQKHGRTLVKILDFGIAKVSGAEGSHSLTRTGAIFGTPHYMSPEQALGKPLDLRTDIYSVGVILYEVFTGRVPFEAESFMGILTKHITAVPARPSEIAPTVSAEIEAIILRAMAKDPAERYASMSELANDLSLLLEGIAPHLLVPPGSAPHAARPTPSGLVRPSQPPFSTPATPVTATALPAAATLDDVDTIPRTRSKTGVIAAALAVLVLGGAAAAFVLFRQAPPPPAAAAPAAPAARAVPAPAVARPAPPAPAAEARVVIVDTEPPQARIFKDGVEVGTTPEEVKVPAGSKAILVLKKDGYVEEMVTVDPALGHKVLVKLEKEHAAGKGQPAPPRRAPKTPVYSSPMPALPRLPASATPPPAPPVAPPVARPAPTRAAPASGGLAPVPTPVVKPVQRKPVADPYERLDDAPAPPAKRGGDVLNPY
jgi:serine/threonine-protein kinase